MPKPSYWRAKFASPCKLCGVYFTIGEDYIGKVATGGYAHQECIELPMPIATNGSNGARLPVAPVVARAPVATIAPVAPVAERVFTPSRYQSAVFDHALAAGNGSLMVQAVAGSGKSTTQKHLIRKLPTSARFVYAPFNRDIAGAFRAAMPEFKEDIRTTHSLGLLNLTDNLGKNGRKVVIKEGKLYDILDMIWARPDYHAEDSEKNSYREKRGAMLKLVDLAKSTLVDPTNAQAVSDMALFYGADLGEYESELIDALPRVLDLCKANPYVADFADMLWLPVVLGMQLRQYDYLLGDEVQDYAAVQVELALRSIAPGGRAVMVGDPNQSLYLFRGADSDAMARLGLALDADSLPLSICYRCPTSHIRLAQAYVPEIEARDDAPTGTVTYMQQGDLGAWVKPGDMLICRTNAPLVPVAFRLIAQGVKAVVRGREIGKSLADLANQCGKGASTVNELLDNLQLWAMRETAKLERRNAPQATIELVADKLEVLQIVAGHHEVKQPADVARKVMALFDEKQPQVTLSTIHKAKGLEAERVAILRPDLLPLPAVIKRGREHEIKGERNACYVAVTRAKDTLAFVEQDDDD